MTEVSARNGPSKAVLRTRLLAARRARPAGALARDRHAIVAAALPRAASVPCVAAYEALPTEPGSTELLDGLVGQGSTVLVPVLLADRDLAWQTWPEREAGRLESAGLVIVAALAVDTAGNRLGRGGGSYDRALRRVAAGTPVIALVFDDEVVAHVPTDPWDRPVTGALTPAGWHSFAPPEYRA